VEEKITVIGMVAPVDCGRVRVSAPGTSRTEVRRPTVTTAEPTPEQISDDEVLTPMTPGAEALPSAAPADTKDEDE
jgi:hypothetical protein